MDQGEVNNGHDDELENPEINKRQSKTDEKYYGTIYNFQFKA